MSSSERARSAAFSGLLVHAEALEPCEQPPAGREREGMALLHLARPRRLADQHHAGVRDRADDRRAEHIGAEAAGGERGQMLIEIHVRLRDVKRLLFILALLPFNA